MLLAAIESRPILWHMPAALQVLWYSLAALSAVVFAYGIARPLLRYRTARRDSLPPVRELPARAWQATRLVFANATVARDNRRIGWAHRGIFYGWVALAIGTVIVGLSHDLAQPIFGAGFYDGGFYLACKAALNALGTALVVGLLAMMARRTLSRSPRLDYDSAHAGSYRAGDWVLVGTLLVIALSGYLLEGVRIAMEHPGYNGVQFGGWLASQAFTGSSQATLGVWRHSIWWSHGLLAIVFVASIPYTKAAHMLTAYASLVVRDPLAGKRLQPIPEELAQELAGYEKLADFSFAHMLQLDACTRCGRCHEVC
ncbi:MAG: hypothetical protein ACYDC2_05425, partial [Solirubrobacteraceae bacterium]